MSHLKTADQITAAGFVANNVKPHHNLPFICGPTLAKDLTGVHTVTIGPHKSTMSRVTYRGDTKSLYQTPQHSDRTSPHSIGY